MNTAQQDNQNRNTETDKHISNDEVAGVTHRDTPEDQTTEESHVEPEDQNPSPSKASREAKKYRIQLRETQTQLETLTTQRDQLAQQAIEHHLPDDMSPAAFWKLTDGPGAFLDDDGLIDANKISETVQQLRDDLGINRTGPVIPGQEKRPHKPHHNNRLEQAFSPK